MSALLTRRRAPGPRREKPRGAPEQAPLFGGATPAPPATVAASAAAAAPDTAAPVEAAAPMAAAAPMEAAAAPERSAPAGARRQGPTLDDLVAGAWEGLLAGAPAACLACGSAMTPRHSAGAGVVGGRCGGCGSTLG